MVSIKFKTIEDFGGTGHAAPRVSGIHSGNAGDVIYSLPAVRALGIRHLVLNVYRDPNPLRRLTEENARALVPLLLAQDYVDRVTLVSAGVPLESVDPECIDVDYVLDRFRRQDALHLHLMHAHALAVHAEIDAVSPFLRVPEDLPEAGEVVLALTPRYRTLTEEFLRDLMLYFDDILILAIPEEWRSVAGIPGRIRKCADYLEMAGLIQQARVFIGNPGLASAIAEGLKAPRIVDLPLEPVNAFPIGPNGYVLPAGRAEFVDIVRRLCGDRPRLASLYSDLLQAVAAESSRLPLIGGVDPARVTLEGGGWTKLAPEENGVFLHPGAPEAPPPRIVFEEILLAGHNCLQADLSVEHPESAPVRFSFHLRDASGATIHQSTREVQPAESVHWQVTFPRNFSAASLEIATSLAAGAESPNYAWAWVRNPQLRVI
ncbi:MAG: hypothetical protein P4L56_03335 [Candidatus Sulfopaludibacter sp.]|nr:hypothetical protein [Candidatus Sulfopaludibacter sp.]